MKTHHLLTLLAAALLYAASPHSSPAADVSLDISSYAPGNVHVALRQIQLNVAIKQYEKVLVEMWEARLQKNLGPAETELTDEQQKKWLVRAESKVSKLEEAEDSMRRQIVLLVEEEDKEKKLMENATARGWKLQYAEDEDKAKKRREKEKAEKLTEEEKAKEKAKPKSAPSQLKEEPRG